MINLFCIYILLFSVMSCKNVKNTAEADEKIEQLVAELNSWHSKELSAYNSKEPEFLVSGETSGYIEVKLDKIRSLGYDVEWNQEKKKYHLIDRVSPE